MIEYSESGHAVLCRLRKVDPLEITAQRRLIYSQWHRDLCSLLTMKAWLVELPDLPVITVGANGRAYEFDARDLCPSDDEPL
ncbi:MAG: hypothetical protein OSB58_14695, partial [Alphaproteobacteria bacterium]|nr:hypothetical protein [Alphaproteobacteria bacterium]